MLDVALILTTVDNQVLAYKIAQKLIEEDIAACAQVDAIQSFYKWNNELENREEYRLMIKAKSSNYKKIEAAILALHNDDTPQIVKIDITEGLPSYLNWVNKN